MNTRPLEGKRILVTRAREQAPAFSREIVARGGVPAEMPVLFFRHTNDKQAVKSVMNRLQTFQWVIFTSTNGVRFFFEELRHENRDFPVKAKVAVVGKKTYHFLQDYGIDADIIPTEFVAEELMKRLIMEIQAGDHILMPRGNLARVMLSEELVEIGADVTDLTVYETMINREYKEKLTALLSKRELDVITFTSSSTVQFFLEMLEGTDWRKDTAGVKIACIGPVTAKTAREYGMPVDIAAGEYSTTGLLDAIEDFYREGSY